MNQNPNIELSFELQSWKEISFRNTYVTNYRSFV